MWTATEHGYFSAVADRDDPTGPELWVRARALADLERLRSAGYETGPITGMKHADYPYRVLMGRAEWARYLSDSVAAIDYPNFKERVHEVDAARADVYMDAWFALTHIENDDWERNGVAEVNEREGRGRPDPTCCVCGTTDDGNLVVQTDKGRFVICTDCRFAEDGAR